MIVSASSFNCLWMTTCHSIFCCCITSESSWCPCSTTRWRARCLSLRSWCRLQCRCLRLSRWTRWCRSSAVCRWCRKHCNCLIRCLCCGASEDCFCSGCCGWSIPACRSMLELWTADFLQVKTWTLNTLKRSEPCKATSPLRSHIQPIRNHLFRNHLCLNLGLCLGTS